MTDARDFDLVLFGATGFVGKLTAQYLLEAAPAAARIALAGRSLDKLTAVRDALGPAAVGWSLLVADAGDDTELATLARRTKVVVTTVGPYLRYGKGLIRACADAGTHYADLTGESPFVKYSIDELHETAVATGARIVPSCGFDSVPSDLNAYGCYRATEQDGTGELTDTTLVAAFKGGFSGGTIDSGRAMMEAAADDRSIDRILADPYSLSPDRALEPDLGRQNDLTLERAAEVDPSLTGWLTTFVMAQHNSKVVRRSNALLGWAYGKNFRYREVMSAGDSTLAPVIAAGVSAGMVGGFAVGRLLSSNRVGRQILDRVLPKPGTGPDEQTRLNGWFRMQTFAHTTSGAVYEAVFAMQGDPGYAATAVLLGESGLALAFDEATLPPFTGILTPVTAMGDVLTERLRAAGATITVERRR
ncbi:saccharopine dehydrogenase family protein [Skermania piniformis]|uniref:Saccharopine dehydrogenase NADP-binding domain-containing protein n=1 Tax=Skermania pinensis TaxID=39122 RepID=A0ABX8S8Z0_9ACTN|nr:saccharopine dehydrogenase NADP-binding domain-containing protein [Skermania piniformis]QXQ14328.1 saccharopine dehydrogenase NADP-binding domain-containing protein [Skermania piniformis]